jgi:hypothetical protein
MRVRTLECTLALTVGCEGGGGPTSTPADASALDGTVDAALDASRRDAALDTGADAQPASEGDAGERVCGQPGDILRPIARELEGCTIYRGELTFADISDASLEGYALSSLRIVEGDVSFFRAMQLRDLSGLARLEKVGGSLSFNRCDDLTSLRQLTALREAGSLDFGVNDQLPTSELDWLRTRIATALPAAGAN